MSDALEHRLAELGRAIDGVIIVADQLEHWLKGDHPPFGSSIAEGLLHYGQPSAAFDLWCGCRAISHLREVWAGTEAAPAPGNGHQEAIL